MLQYHTLHVTINEIYCDKLLTIPVLSPADDSILLHVDDGHVCVL